MKKLIFSFILILICLIPVSSKAGNDIFSYSFLSEEESEMWAGGLYDESISFGKGYSIFIANPFGEVKNSHVTHVLDYVGTVHLEAGKTYTLSGYVMNPLSEHNQTVNANAKLQNNANTIIVSVSGANSSWSKFSTTFYSGNSGDFNLSIHFLQGNVDFGFFADELILREEQFTVSSISARGVSEILIPTSSETKVSFSPYLIASDLTEISVLSTGSIVSSCSSAENVEYNPDDFTLTVKPGAVPSTDVYIDFALHNYKDISPYTIKVSLTDNIIKDSFSDKEALSWMSSSLISFQEEQNNSYISFPTNDYGDFGYFSAITYDTPQLLVEGELYVLYAKVRSDLNIDAADIYAKNSATLNGNTVCFEIKDISGSQWCDVFAAFIPDKSGIYNISVNLYSMYDCTVFIDDIRLSSELSRPQYITLHAPGNISLPDAKTSYPVSALLRDQMGNIIETENITVNLSTDNTSLQFDSSSKLITVFPDTVPGEYHLTAYYNDNPAIYAELPFTVSFNYIGDGSFEEKLPNEWWLASSPYNCDFYIRNDGTSKRALINCDGDYFIFLNNSYVNLFKNVPYVFNGSFSTATDCTVTLFIESLDMVSYPLAQINIPAGTVLNEKLAPELFLQEDNVTGRFFLYIQSDNARPFSIYADNLSLEKASIKATNLHISGDAQINGACEAQFSFHNSIAKNNDTSSCIVNWYVADRPTAQFTMLSDYGKNIYFDTTFLNKYVYFEVIPVCPITGFSGDAVRTMPFKITYESSSSELFTIPMLSEAATDNYFSDTTEHWCRESVNLLAKNNIINGRYENLFCPDEYITRAEFAKLVSTAFLMKPSTDFSPFTDISQNDWYYENVCALNLAGIINGTSSDTFSPHAFISREDAATILMRIYERIKTTVRLPVSSNFKDQKNISSYAQKYVSYAAALNIARGNPDGEFLPTNNITRSEAAVLLKRLIEVLC